MQPLSPQQYAACAAGHLPAPERIAGDLWSFPVRMPGGFLGYSLCVVHLGSAGVTVIDPGWESPAALASLERFLARFGRDLASVRVVVATHSHPDHIGLAPRLRDMTGAELVWGRREQDSMDADPRADAEVDDWGAPAEVVARLRDTVAPGSRVPSPRADRLLDDGDGIDLDGMRLRAVLTPGHTPGHLCFVDEEGRVLLAGDHVLPTVFPGIGLAPAPGPDPVGDYLAALDRLAVYDDCVVVPGHGYHFRGLAGRRAATAQHVQRRADEVAAVLQDDPECPVWEIAAQLTWTGGWDQVREGAMLSSALSQTALYRRFVRSADRNTSTDLHPDRSAVAS